MGRNNTFANSLLKFQGASRQTGNCSVHTIFSLKSLSSPFFLVEKSLLFQQKDFFCSAFPKKGTTEFPRSISRAQLRLPAWKRVRWSKKTGGRVQQRQRMIAADLDAQWCRSEWLPPTPVAVGTRIFQHFQQGISFKPYFALVLASTGIQRWILREVGDHHLPNF